jgi:protein phosphatase-4 regulatory subunit 3
LVLFSEPSKVLHLQVIKFIKSVLMNGEENLNKLVINNDVMSHVLKMFDSNKAKDNLLMSSILDLFEYIKKQNMKKIISYLVR